MACLYTALYKSLLNTFNLTFELQEKACEMYQHSRFYIALFHPVFWGCIYSVIFDC